MQCPQCGKTQINSNNKFCTNCGYETPVSLEITNIQNSNVIKKKRKLSSIVFLLAMIFLILGGGWTLLLIGPTGDTVSMLFWLFVTVPIYFLLSAGLVALPLAWPPSILFAYWYDNLPTDKQTFHRWQIVCIYIWSIIAAIISISLLSFYQKSIDTNNAFLESNWASGIEILHQVATIGGFIVPSIWILITLLPFNRLTLSSKAKTITLALCLIITNALIIYGGISAIENSAKANLTVESHFPKYVYMINGGGSLMQTTAYKNSDSVFSSVADLRHEYVVATSLFSSQQKRALKLKQMDNLSQPACSKEGYLPDFIQSMYRSYSNKDPLIQCTLAFKTTNGINVYRPNNTNVNTTNKLYFNVHNTFVELSVVDIVPVKDNYPKFEVQSTDEYENLLINVIDTLQPQSIDVIK